MTQALATATIIDLAEEGEVDLSTLLTGPLRQARLVVLPAQQAETLSADDREHTLFFLEGAGTAQSGGTLVDVSAGTAVTVPQGSTVTVSALGGPLRYFHASLMVAVGAA
ncbi:hypothetical protein AB0P15_28540 [Streptomyces sp. NPDC087917]|uniref:hypothetical protein n=1 Tax=Streptomyces sp. NPDC087917 TaxID=3155060 RepID=UPI0034326875